MDRFSLEMIASENNKVVLDTSAIILFKGDSKTNSRRATKKRKLLMSQKMITTAEVARECSVNEPCPINIFYDGEKDIGGLYKAMRNYLAQYEESALIDLDKKEKYADISVIALTLTLAHKYSRVACVSRDSRLCQTLAKITSDHHYINSNDLNHPKGFPFILKGDISIYWPETCLRQFTPKRKYTEEESLFLN